MRTPTGEARVVARHGATMPWWRRAMPLLGLALLGWVLSRLDLAAIGGVLAGASRTAVLLAALSFSANFLIKALRWHRMLIAQNRALPLSVSFGAFFNAQFYGQVTLGRVGELYRAEALIERGVPIGEALSSSIFDRVLDLMCVTAIAGVLGTIAIGRPDIAPAAFSVLVLLALVVWVLAGRAQALPDDRGDPLPAPTGLLARAVGLVRDLRRGVRSLLRPAPIAEMLGWTVLAWVGYFGALVALARGLAIDAPVTLLVAASALAALSALLPVTVSGLGARELIFMAALALEGIAAERAVALSLLHLAVMTACALSFGLVGMWWRKQQRARDGLAASADVERPGPS